MERRGTGENVITGMEEKGKVSRLDIQRAKQTFKCHLNVLFCFVFLPSSYGFQLVVACSPIKLLFKFKALLETAYLRFASSGKWIIIIVSKQILAQNFSKEVLS